MTTTDYPQLFQTLVNRRLQQVNQVIQSDAFIHDTIKQGQALQALTYAMAKQPENSTGIIQLLCSLAPLMEQVGYRKIWRSFLVKGCDLCEQVGDWAAEAELSYQAGILFHRQSDFTKARHWLEQALTAYEVATDLQGQSKVLHQLAFIACLQHDYDRASTLIEQAAPLAGDDPILHAMTYFLKGTILMDFQRWSEAEHLFRKALALRTAAGDQRRVAWSMLDLANALRHQKRFDEAGRLYEESAAILLTLADTHTWARTQMSLGLIAFNTGNLTSALTYYRAAISILKKHGDFLDMARIQVNIGLVLLSTGRAAEAQSAFRDAVQGFCLLNDMGRELNARDGLAMSLLAQYQFEEARALLERSLTELASLKQLPNYDYLLSSMQKHLAEAKGGLNA